MISVYVFQSTHPRGVRPVNRSHSFRSSKFQSTHTRGVRHDDFAEVVWQTKVSIHAPTRGATNQATMPLNSSMFQSTHPRGVRRHILLILFNKLYVSIHAPTRGATVRHSHVLSEPGFNPRTHEGCDVRINLRIYGDSGFNPRTHEGCDIQLKVSRTLQIGFNPRTHEGCDPAARKSLALAEVSIHAPTRGATDNSLGSVATFYVSIHAPTRGATTFRCVTCRVGQGFNPRTHEGCDRYILQLCRHKRVSIHAPTRGATAQIRQFYPSLPFQSTHPRGVRLHSSTHLVCNWSFNPRTHEGCDGQDHKERYLYLVSIHAPTRGATCLILPILSALRFQSTHPRGVRLLTSIGSVATFYVSIHAPTRGATIWQEQKEFNRIVSIHAPTRGATI